MESGAFPIESSSHRIRSRFPVSAITRFRTRAASRERYWNASCSWENSPILSTPSWASAPVKRVWISELFPFKTPDQGIERSSAIISLRYADAPAPTGSNITGIPFFAAVSSARRQDRNFSSDGCPILTASPSADPVISSISSFACAINGRPPAAEIASAHSAAVT